MLTERTVAKKLRIIDVKNDFAIQANTILEPDGALPKRVRGAVFMAGFHPGGSSDNAQAHFARSIVNR